MAIERMASADAAWLHMDRPDNLPLPSAVGHDVVHAHRDEWC
jgi:hypothetical protein